MDEVQYPHLWNKGSLKSGLRKSVETREEDQKRTVAVREALKE